MPSTTLLPGGPKRFFASSPAHREIGGTWKTAAGVTQRIYNTGVDGAGGKKRHNLCHGTADGVAGCGAYDQSCWRQASRRCSGARLPSSASRTPPPALPASALLPPAGRAQVRSSIPSTQGTGDARSCSGPYQTLARYSMENDAHASQLRPLACTWCAWADAISWRPLHRGGRG